VHRSRGLPFYSRTAPGADPLRLTFLLPMLAATTAKVVRRHAIDVVHAHHYEGLLAAWPARRLSRVPVIYDAHTTLAGELPYYRHGLPRRGTVAVGRQLDRYLPRLVDHTVATSQHIATELIADGIRTDRVTILGNGIEDAFVVGAIEPPCLDTHGERVVYAGNLAGYQGIDTLLEAFALVAVKRPASRLVLLTETAFDRYRALAERLGIADRIDLEMPPPPHALGTRLATAAVLVNPRAECPGYPLKLLNYMAAGRAIVSFRDSARDLTHGRDAWLVDEANPSALAAGLLEMLERPDRAADLGATARRRVVQDLTWSRVAGKLDVLYQELVRGRRRATDAAPAAYGAAGGD
jgi:glycosyltransferase involved in cell wall biosynthesis